jgi:methyltransferase (TIGR00027 family)
MGPSQTAQLAAAHRAYHLLHDRPTILEDSAASWLLGLALCVVLRTAPLRWLVFERLLARFRPIRVFIVVRSRYAEDCLGRSFREGFRQYVILGAGLDSWALRQQMQGVSVFELDQVAKMLHSAGFGVVEDLPASEIRRHYLSQRSDGLGVPGFVRVCFAEC